MDNRVFIAKCESYEQAEVAEATARCFSALGLDAADYTGKRVVIKPNLLMPRRPDAHTTTHPEVFAALARTFTDADAQVKLVESCGGPYNNVVLKQLYRACGMEAAANETGAELNFDTSYTTLECPHGRELNSFSVISPALDADLLITAAKLKTHGISGMSCAVKNLYGVIPGLIKASLHAKLPDQIRFCRMLVDLCELIKPGFSIIDGVVGMEGQGPSGGTPKKVGVLIASRNPYAADLAACHLVTINPATVPILRDAYELGLVCARAADLTWLGDDPSLFKTTFMPAIAKVPGTSLPLMPAALRPLMRKIFSPYPQVIKQKCIGCGECVRICPKDQIVIETGKALIDYKNCIKCYCCHEMCPVKAMDLSKKRR